MASRSVQVHFNNTTDSTLTLQSATLSGGIWSQDDQPPPSIAPHTAGQFGSESDGTATGTGGSVVYVLSAGGSVTLNWEDPFIGGNTYSSVAPPGYQCPWTGGSGDNANVTFTLIPPP